MSYNAMIHGTRFTAWLRFKAFSFFKNRQKTTVINNSKEKKILFYPPIKSPEKLLKILCKTSYAFPRNDHLEFHLAAPREVLSETKKQLKELLASGTHQIDGLKLIRHEPKSRIEYERYNLILCHTGNALPGIFKYFHKTEIIDDLFFSYTESLTFQKSYYTLLDEQHKSLFKELSDNNIDKLWKKLAVKKEAYCFLTGPSMSQYQNLDIQPSAVKIICNSLVKNKAFLLFIGGPDIITFADPVFHFGASDYAVKFRENMLEVVKKYNPYVVVPDFSIPLLLSWFPDLADNIIGLKTIENECFLIPSPDKPIVKASDNIMTMFMLPMAASLADHIYIAGADGRGKKESYFWKFSTEAQFSDEMQSAFNAHPSFFRDRSYNKYYEAHCRIVGDMIQWLEDHGKTIAAITPSIIPALEERFKTSKHEP